MTDAQQRTAAKKFVKDWTGRGYEKGDSQPFWMTLLHDVYGVENPAQFIYFEDKVVLDNTSFIDGHIPTTHVLIEQKGIGKDLRTPIKQSDGIKLTPFQQAKRYSAELPYSQRPRWIVTCNFAEFNIYDMEHPMGDPEVVYLKDLEKDCYRLQFLVDTQDSHIKKEMEVSLQAGTLVGKLYDALLKQYNNPPTEKELKSLNMLCVRLVFCLYAEDSGIFGHHNMFHDYLNTFKSKNVRKALIDLFAVLNQKPEDRDPYMDDDLAAFPYVNGGLFEDNNIIIPKFTDEIVDLLLHKASEDFDWSSISPTIFGAVFESTLNPETRRDGGMHYTSIEDIHRVIDPLFLDDLYAEFEEISSIKIEKTKIRKLEEFQSKLATLRFLDPACGSGNFLTETYLSLRRLENKVLSIRFHDQMVLGGAENLNPIQVSIDQFSGIEINDFAVTVAKTAMWIAESQMMKETEEIVHMPLEFLPLHTNANIVEDNALNLEWETIVPKSELDFIIGNPPFKGYSLQTTEQKREILKIYVDEQGKPYKSSGKIDYVSGWYFKAAEMMQNSNIRTAFISTNSITQGEQVEAVWKPLYDRFGIHIDFAHRTFRWDNRAEDKDGNKVKTDKKMAAVHCVVVGFSVATNDKPRIIFSSKRPQIASNINAYLIDAPTTFIASRTKPICKVPEMTSGNRPADGGHLIIEASEYDEFIKKEPAALPYIRRLSGATEFINNKKRWCLWLVGIQPSELRKMPEVMKRVELCRQDRLSGAEDRQKLALTPTLFRETKNPETAIVIPRHSSENRNYIPFGFIGKEMILTDAAMCIPNATVYDFGILESNVHMAWVRSVCGRIKSDYRYSKDVVYNNFPWPTPTDAQRAKIEQTAQAILDARALYPESSLADLYDELTMPPELRKAHQQNDRAVWEAYGKKWKISSATECVAELMKMYQELTNK